MAIETLQDLNAQACCCELPLCPVPVMVCESISIAACGYELPPHEDMPPEDRCVRFRRRKVRQDASIVDRVSVTSNTSTTNYTGHDEVVKEKALNEAGTCAERFLSGELYYNEHVLTEPNGGGYPIADQTYTMSTSAGPSNVWTGTFTYTNTVTPEDNYSDSATTASPVFDITEDGTWDYTSPGVYFYDFTEGSGYDSLTVTITYEEEISSATLTADLDEKIAALEEDVWPGTGCQSTLDVESVYDESDPPVLLCQRISGATKARVFFQIPATWTDPVTGASAPFPGNYFKITYDIIEEPAGWDDPEPSVSRSVFSEDAVIEWTGPGTGEQNDPSWRLAPIILNPPTVPGRRYIANIRFVCRENWFVGDPSQVTGPAVEITEP